ncbi:hypothetical protein EON67_00975 [archaeon]|nr:MAG: hypothetical protein EON67_00975 [archaeon]
MCPLRNRTGESYVVVTCCFATTARALVCSFHVTKWVHLLHGDEGVRRLFQRVYDALAPGGRLVATFQTWDSYARSASICDETGRYYPDLKLRPDAFVEYLLSPAGGFRRLELSTRVSKPSGRGSTQLVVFQK